MRIDLRIVAIAVALVSGSSASSADLRCTLKLDSQIVATAHHPVAKLGDTSGETNKFHLELTHGTLAAHVSWNQNGIYQAIRNSEELLGERIDRWTQPLEQNFYFQEAFESEDSEHVAQFHCLLDASDGDSLNWHFFKSEFDFDLERIQIRLRTLSKLAAITPANPPEEAELNNGLCFFIGEFSGLAALNDLLLKTSTITEYVPGPHRFPELYSLVRGDPNGLHSQIQQLSGFCIPNQKRNDLNFYGDRVELSKRVQNLSSLAEKIGAYVETQYPDLRAD